MFENAKSISAAESLPLAGGDEHANPVQAEGSDASLRMIEWSELTARLSAARDLRALLRRDAIAEGSDPAGNFATDAAGYFRDKHQSELNVNPVTLGGSKGSRGIIQKRQGVLPKETQGKGHAATGDAREF